LLTPDRSLRLPDEEFRILDRLGIAANSLLQKSLILCQQVLSALHLDLSGGDGLLLGGDLTIEQLQIDFGRSQLLSGALQCIPGLLSLQRLDGIFKVKQARAGLYLFVLGDLDAFDAPLLQGIQRRDAALDVHVTE
jgi:hypothetical protein